MSCNLSFRPEWDLWQIFVSRRVTSREADVVAILLVGVQDFSVLYKELEAQKWHSGRAWRMSMTQTGD